MKYFPLVTRILFAKTAVDFVAADILAEGVLVAVITAAGRAEVKGKMKLLRQRLPNSRKLESVLAFQLRTRLISPAIRRSRENDRGRRSDIKNAGYLTDASNINSQISYFEVFPSFSSLNILVKIFYCLWKRSLPYKTFMSL